MSDPFNGGTIVVLPDTPINFVGDFSVISSTVIGLLWDNGSSEGGTPIIDYAISYDQASGVWVELATGITV
jgi:hypothetical protein